MSFKIEGKEIYPIFIFANCCWSVHSVAIGNPEWHVRKASHRFSKQQ